MQNISGRFASFSEKKTDCAIGKKRRNDRIEQKAGGGIRLFFDAELNAVYFLLARGEVMIGKTDTERLLTLCFSLPGAFVLFLPGCAPLLFFLIALIIYFSFARFATMQICLSDYAYRVLLVFISVASAAVLFAAVAGKFA